MIAVIPLNGKPAECFKNYSELFDHLTTLEGSPYLTNSSNFEHTNWSFKIYPTKQVAALYAHSKNPSTELQEAFKENLCLIKICAGDYKKPSYMTLTPNVDMGYLKKKWCIDYCTFHHLLLREL